MPRLTYGKYSWRLSSDDLAAPVCYALTGRLLWMMVASTTIARLYEGLEFCTSGQLIISYLIISLATYLFTTIIDINIARKSFQGTIVELNLRRGTGLLVFIRITLSILQIIILVPGIVGLGLLTQGIPCGQDAESTKVNLGILVILLFTQLVHSIVALSCCQLCLQTSPANAEKRAQQENREKIENRLRKIVRVVGRGGGGGASERSGSGDAGVRQVAEVMDRFFHSEGGDLDIVFSDILAGMVLLRHLQHHRRVLAFRELQSHPPPLSSLPYVTYPNIHPADPSFRDQIIVTALLPRGRLRVIETNFLPSHPINASLLRSVARYSIYCCFPYSDTYVFHGQVGNALCRQADGIQFYRGCYFGSRVRTFEREGEGGLKGLNFCSKDLTRLSSKRFALEETELIFMSDANDLDHKPYAVFVDHYHQEVVLTLRGTMTLEDAVTDALCLPISLEEAGRLWGFDGRDRYAHDGMLRVAMGLRRELEDSQMLQRLLYPHFRLERGEYSLILTGHSLGAGVAVLLALLLKDAFPSLRCFAYGAPGALTDILTARDLESYVTSLVLGNDVIPRTSFKALCLLRDDILDCICRAKGNKTSILSTMASILDVDQVLYEEGQEPDSQFKQSLLQFKASVQHTYEELESKTLFVAGKIVHFVKTVSVREGLSDSQDVYEMSYGLAQDYKEIAVSATMITEHLPNSYFTEINRVAKREIDYNPFNVE